MTTPQVQQTRVAPVVQESKPAVQTGKDSSGRTVSVARLHYDNTSSWASKPATSENRFVAALQKTGNLAVALFCAIAETARNILAGVYNVVFAAPVNFVGGFFHKKEEPVQEPTKPVVQQPVVSEQPKPVVAEKIVLPVKRTLVEKLSDGTKAAVSSVKSAAIDAATAVRNNPGKTALAVATGVAAYYGYKHLTAQPAPFCQLPGNTNSALSYKIGEAMTSNCKVPPVVEGACRDQFFDVLEATKTAYESSKPSLWSSVRESVASTVGSVKGSVASVLGSGCRGTAAITPTVAKNVFKSVTRFPGCPAA